MAEYVVYYVPRVSDRQDTLNGVSVDAKDHEDALHKRVQMQHATDSGEYWVSGPVSLSNPRSFELQKFRIKATSYAIENPLD